MQWMASELSVGHHRLTSPGDVPAAPKAVPGGLLGADYAVENGRYRFKKVYGGLNLNPGAAAPLTEPGVNVQAGEYLLAVNGRDLRATTNLFSLFENTSGKIVELTVGPNRRRHRLAHGAGRADRERARAAQSRLGGGQPAQGRSRDQRAGRATSTCPTPPSRDTPTSSATSTRRRTRTPSSSTSASTAAARSPTTTSTRCGGRSSATGRCATERTSRRRPRRSRGRR